MLIERVETYPLLYRLEQPYGDANGYKRYRSCFLLRMITNTGADGWGEVIDWLPTLDRGFRERIIPYLLGKPATERLQLVQVIKKWHQRAAAGVSMALTEILAKEAGLSITQLWGGALRRTIPVYASFQSYREQPDWQHHSLRLVEQAAVDGFTCVKIKIGGRSIKEDQQHVQKLQSMLGEQLRFALDANQSYDVAAVKAWEKWFRQWENLLWLEEPLPLDRVQDYALLRSRLPVPLAGGENMKSPAQFLPLVKNGALDLIQPDTMHVDGIDAFRDTLQLARHFGLRTSPHAYDGALSRLYALMAQACLPAWSKMETDDIEPVEWDVMENPFNRLVPLSPCHGTVTLPEGAGIGVELDWELIEAYRWDGSTYT